MKKQKRANRISAGKQLNVILQSDKALIRRLCKGINIYVFKA